MRSSTTATVANQDGTRMHASLPGNHGKVITTGHPLGHPVRAPRRERTFSREHLGEESGLHPRYISAVGRGRRNVSMLNVGRLVRAVSVDLPTFMAEVEAKRSG
jgi:hypothetical protein